MSDPTVVLPEADGTLRTYRPGEPRDWRRPDGPITSRIAFAAAHVVADPRGGNAPGAPAVVDWEATLAFRRHLWGYGLGVAEAMDTAQRGMGLDWPAARELIRRSAAEARACGGRIAAGVGTDDGSEIGSLGDVLAAYERQLEYVVDAGAQPILMASRALASLATRPDDYVEVYGRLLKQAGQPVILHWLGEMFDPALAGYWGSRDLAAATETFVGIVGDHADRIDGVKVSLLDADHERRLRGLLPAGVRIYTGDDFNYPELIADAADGRHSDALLGVFAAIAPAASAALQALDRGDVAGFDREMSATVPLARHLFAAPTYYYKTGIAFLAWLSGHQAGFTMVGGLESGRDAVHLARAYRLADELGLFPDPELAVARVRTYLSVKGIA